MKTWSGVQQCLTVTLWITLLPNVVLSQCGGHLTGESGEFMSPNFPEKYPDNTECNWEITVPEGKKVNLRFLSFNLEHELHCSYDKLNVYDGADANARKIGQFCGTDSVPRNRPGNITSSGNKLYVKLKTDYSGGRKGFAARFNSIEEAPSVPQFQFPVCIDNSDCIKLDKADKYACFQYICYPWKDDSIIEPKNRRKPCRIDNDCEQGQECFIHHDKRMVNRGLCFDEDKNCHNANECSKGYQCCGGTCCEERYYQEFAKLPCISDLGCRDLGLGQYCCSQNGTGKQCSDIKC